MGNIEFFKLKEILMRTINRRKFISMAAASSAMVAVACSRLKTGAKRPEYVPPSDKINLALIGSGTMGLNMLMGSWLPCEDLHISCVCDPNTNSTDYRDWSRYGIRDRIRSFLEKPKWGEGDKGIRAGREVGQYLIETYYGKKIRSGNYTGCRAYADFRELLEKETNIDGVIIMTPDHLHATIAIAAMKKGKHVISHKPVSNVLHEVRLAVETEREQKVATHLLAWLQNEGMYQIRDWLVSGVIGPVREVHNWSNRPVWPQGWLGFPEKQRVPKGLDWDLWLGPEQNRPYNLNYTHALFRGWYDFGSGCLGDMGNYSLWKVYRMLDLGAPVSVEAMASSDAKVEDGVSGPCRSQVAFPHASAIRFRHPARGEKPPIDVYWYDGGIKPMTPPELYEAKEELAPEGIMFVGDEGKIIADFGCGKPYLYPESKRKEVKKGAYDNLPSGQDEWIKAIKNGTTSPGSFKEAQHLAEATCLGNLAVRLNRRLDWDDEGMQFTNMPDANQYVRRNYRSGWEL
jgi:hypothetical protein